MSKSSMYCVADIAYGQHTQGRKGNEQQVKQIRLITQAGDEIRNTKNITLLGDLKCFQVSCCTVYFVIDGVCFLDEKDISYFLVKTVVRVFLFFVESASLLNVDNSSCGTLSSTRSGDQKSAELIFKSKIFKSFI